MYALSNKTTWRIFQKACSLILVLTFSSYVLPEKGLAGESVNYRLSNFITDSSGEKSLGTTYNLSHNTLGEAVSGDLASANIETKSGFLRAIIKEGAENPPTLPQDAGLLAESANFRAVSYLLSIAGGQAASTNFNISLASVGEPVGGVLDNYYDKASSGHIYTLLGNPPLLTYNIPAQNWPMNTSRTDVLDLDDYFLDPDGDSLVFTITGNSQIIVSIDPATHQLSLSPNRGFVGCEEMIITAFDSEGNRFVSHPVTLNVYNTGMGVNNPPALSYIGDITAKEGELIKITPQATDPDGNSVIYSFSAPFDSQGRWQTDYQSAGIYSVTVTASDGVLTDSQELKVTVLNINRRPALNYISDITSPENQLISLAPSAFDPDGDTLTFSFSHPFNDQGQWRPSYQDCGARVITVIVSDGSLTDSQDLLVNVTNVNTTPVVSISLDRINAAVDEEITFTITAFDVDRDQLTLQLEKDGQQFYSGGIYEFHIGQVAFSSLGTHTIKAIVQDNHGAQAQSTSNVEVIKPRDLWNIILPLLGDFNGDGLVDIGTYNRDSGRWAVALSNAGGFGSITEWLANFGASASNWQYVNGDFNGDGKTDIAIFNKNNGQWQVGLSDGVRFSDQGVWATFSNTSGNSVPITGDFNGDGISDVGTYNKANGDLKCALSDKSRFSPETVWLSGLAHSDQAQTFSGDFNGDGLIDIGVFNDGSWNFAVSDGTKFIFQNQWSISFGATKIPVISDFNHDSLTDIGVFDKGVGRWQVYHCTGNGFVESGDWLNNFGQGQYNTPYALDYNGDGLTDAAVFDNSDFRWQKLAAEGKVADLLQRITNSLGGTTEITYKSSVSYDNTGEDDQCDLPFAIQTISAVKQGDGLGNFYQTNYLYANGFYLPQERESRGFGYVEVIDNEGNVSQNWFKQDDIFKGLPDRTQLNDSRGHLYLTSKKTYAYTTPYPGCTLTYLEEEETSSYDGQITPRVSKTIYEEYDNYGNPTRIKNLGDVGITGDEKESNIEYVYNTDLWILGLPAYSCLKDAQGNLASQKWIYYDSHASINDAPTKGDLTKEEVWCNNPLTSGYSLLTTSYSYDEYGNILTKTDPRENTIITVYDETYHTYPIATTNALGQQTLTTYNPKTGQALTSTDPNNQTTRNEYDLFGRLIKVFGPNDDASHPGVWYEYDLTTRPAKIIAHRREEYNTNDPSKIRTGYTFIDGLGRTIQNKTEAADPEKQIVSGVVIFNGRGLVKHKYLPYLTTKTADYTTPDLTLPKVTYEYDCAGRMVKLINPDATYQAMEYRPGIVTAIDENGHQIRKHLDIFSQTVRIEEFNRGRIYTTSYVYDAQGNLSKTTDDQGNVTRINYDSLGRKLSMSDPDMGEWTYDYDANSNLIRQTDAKGQVLEFIYDALNRLTSKRANGQTIVIYTYDVTTKPYCIGRLSKVTDQSGSSEFFYDNLGREVKSIKTIAGVAYAVQRSYDAQGKLRTLIYPDGEIVTYGYNPQGITSLTSQTSQTIQTYVSSVDYSASGQMLRIAYGNGTHTDYEYNPLTLRLELLLTNDGVLQNFNYTFDNVGNVKTITDQCHSATQSFYYDDLNRLTSALGQTYGSKTYKYDSIGNILEKEGVTYTYGENGAGPHAVTSLTRQMGTTSQTSIAYDANGNMVTKGEQVFTYNSENRLAKAEGPIKQPVPAVFNLTLQPGWNFVSLPVIPEDAHIANAFSSIQFGPDYDQVSRYNTDNRGFDNYNHTSYSQFDTLEYGRGYLVYIKQACVLSLQGSVTAELISRQLKSGWNLIGTPSTQQISVSAALNNLRQGIDYDRVARYNKTTQFFENLSANDLLNPGEACYLYCLRDAIWQLPQLQETTTFTYDGDGGRVKKTTTNPSLPGAAGVEAVSTTYIGSIYEVDSDGAIRKHIFSGSNRVATSQTSSTGKTGQTNQTYFYHGDYLGSSNLITNEQGAIAQLLEYLPYGAIARTEGADLARHKFTGKELDNTGLYYYGARYYDPELGRFTQADTIVQDPSNPQTLNRYSYCNNNPVNYIDPTGHGWWKDFWQSIVGIVTTIASIIFPPIAPVMWAVNMAISAYTAINTGNMLGLAGGIVGGALFGAVGKGLASGIVARMSDSAFTFGGGALIGAVEFGIGGFGAGFGAALASGEGFTDSLKAGGYGAAFGAATGAAIQGSYMAGWQDVLHGLSIPEVGLAQGNLALQSGNLQSLSAIDSAVKSRTKNQWGLYLHGTDVEHSIPIAISRQLKIGSWLTKPGAIDALTGKMAIQLNPVEYQRFCTMPRPADIFALTVAPNSSISYQGLEPGGAPKYLVIGPNKVTNIYANPNP